MSQDTTVLDDTTMGDPEACAATQKQEDEEPDSQSTPAEKESHPQEAWGYLEPHPGETNLFPKKRFYLLEDEANQNQVTIGRAIGCTIRIDDIRVSSKHLVLKWKGVVHGRSRATITRYSTNTTWINGGVLGQEAPRLLKHEDEISFLNSIAPPAGNTTMHDYRFTYYDLKSPKREVLVYWNLEDAEGLELGRGTFGIVYKAHRKSDGHVFAVKHISAVHSAQPNWNAQGVTLPDESERQKLREIAILKGLVHPNICQLHAYFWNADGSVDLVLDYVDGGNLLHFLNIPRKTRGLSERMTKHLMRQLCRALAVIHQRNITHRDLKPENILLTSHRPPILKVADFGLAKLVKPEAMMMSLSGTPSFAAPEFVDHLVFEIGYPPFTVDVWAAGIVMFICVTGRYWFSGPAPSTWDAVRSMDRSIPWETLNKHVVSWDNEGYPVYLSSAGRSFIRGLLKEDHVERLTMAQALEHHWFPSDGADLYAEPPASHDAGSSAAPTVPPDGGAKLVPSMNKLSVQETRDSSSVQEDNDITPTGSLQETDTATPRSVLKRHVDVGQAVRQPEPAHIQHTGAVLGALPMAAAAGSEPGQSNNSAQDVFLGRAGSPAVKRPRSPESEEIEMDVSPRKKLARGRERH